MAVPLAQGVVAKVLWLKFLHRQESHTMKNIILYIFALFYTSGFSQESLAAVLKKYNKERIPYIAVSALSKQENAVILDSRALAEYNISHLKHAVFVGYDDFNLKQTIKKLNNKQQTIIVYCSIGIRSEDIAEKLKKAGYTNVYNLYGGIFEWKNRGFKVYNSQEQETDSIHTYSKKWGKWLKKGIKIYD